MQPLEIHVNCERMSCSVAVDRDIEMSLPYTKELQRNTHKTTHQTDGDPALSTSTHGHWEAVLVTGVTQGAISCSLKVQEQDIAPLTLYKSATSTYY